MKQSLLFFVAFMCTATLFAQDKHSVCGAKEYHDQLYKTSQKYRDGYDEARDILRKNKIKNYKAVSTMSGTEYHVPVVVHVIHTGGGIGTNYNPSVATINALIAQINNGFANTFDDSNVSGTFNSVDIPIRFYLAQRTDDCLDTSGINRIDFSSNSTYVTSGVRRTATDPGVTDATIKGLVHWNDLNYYNIYIVNKINGEDGYTTTGSYVAGYANYPIVGGTSSDGMVCLAYSAADATSTTFIHEMGHGFDLAHTFDGGSTTVCPSNTNCNTDNDEVCDTEPILQSFACNPTGINPCNSMNWNTQTAQWNYMSYNGCTDRFTAGQSTRVMNALNNVRTSLKNSAGIDPAPSASPLTIAGPSYNSTNNGNFADMGPRNVGFNSIDHTSRGYSYEGAGNVHYVDNTCNQTTTILVGAPYTLNVLTSGNNQKAVAYIDWDNNGVFGNTASELVMSSNGNGSPPQTHTTSVTAPGSAVLNTPLRMRVLTDFGTNPTITPTGQLNYGQAEDFTVTVIGAALPVLWRSISANLNYQNNIDVRWSTEMEHNSSIFEIEKSKDGVNFYNIGRMKAAGNSELPRYYNFEDKDNVNGYNYYRIKQIDIDGKSSYSKVATELIKSNETDIVIFPNPTSGNLYLNLSGLPFQQNNVSYVISDLNGKIWSKKEIQVNAHHTRIIEHMEGVPSGLYFVQMRINGKLSVHKVSKQF